MGADQLPTAAHPVATGSLSLEYPHVYPRAARPGCALCREGDAKKPAIMVDAGLVLARLCNRWLETMLLVAPAQCLFGLAMDDK